MRHWYDGYRFGDEEVYNPWSVVKFTKDLCADREAFPSPYWANTSSNSIVRGLVERADISVRGELEALIEGSTIEKPVHEDITYGDVYQSEDNLWNFLFFTGYLRQTDRRMVGEDQYIEMAIPNAEVRYIYKNTILSWFDQKVRNMDLGVLYEAIEHGNFRVMEEEISSQLQETISFYDYAQSYYHGFLTGLLKNIGKYRILSNRESGKGRPDIILKTPSIRGRAVILEIKVSAKFSDMEKACASALRQIKEQKYDAELRDEGYTEILKYGISFYKKECMVRM
ncbi:MULTISPECIES: PD-(D/E)XK nuclease domain-containing protein [Blautia]|uniref:PD-(D/E)XK nuclease domain-containing protein n=1 Tax=Blautia TaxID=572511 RepID=UPI001FAAFBDD|nr:MULTISPECIES: PD-(D/E)XK nuclease domain-containing protein [Blautia]